MIKVVKGDITKICDVQAIVNAANWTLLGGAGVDGAIHKAAGVRLLFECILLLGCKTGCSKITKGHKLLCDSVIHTVGPVWYGGKKNEEKKLESCYISSLQIALENGIRTVAFPSISTGIYGFPITRAVPIAINTVKKFIELHPDCFDYVEFVLFDDETKALYDELI